MQLGRAISRALLVHPFFVCVVCFVWLGTASGAPRGARVDKSKEVAQKVYVEGVDHYRAGRYAEALAAFRASYEMVPSPNSHLMVARTLREHGQLVDAYVEFGRVVLEADAAAEQDVKYLSAAQASRAERAKLRARIAMVTVYVKDPPADVKVVVGDRVIERESWGRPIAMVPGALVARATAGGRPDQRQEIVAVPGGELVVPFDFGDAARPTASEPPTAAPAKPAKSEPPFPPYDGLEIPRQPAKEPRPPPDRTWAYVSFGAGAAGLATFVAFGVVNESVFNSLHSKCPNGRCDPSLASEADKGRRAQTIANVGFGVAVVGGTVGAILLVYAGAGESAKSDEIARTPARFKLTDVSITPHAVGVGGEF
jgi:hypothetical protein